MEEKSVNEIIAFNLRRIRAEKNLSLDEVAKLTNVSKSMINRIEMNKSTPSVTVLWKIADGLKISFSALMDSEIENATLIEKSEFTPIIDAGYQVYNYIPYNSSRKFESFFIELAASSKHISTTHDEALFEYVFVVSGSLEVEYNDNSYTIEQENMLKFDANSIHTYINVDSKPTKALIIITYP